MVTKNQSGNGSNQIRMKIEKRLFQVKNLMLIFMCLVISCTSSPKLNDFDKDQIKLGNAALKKAINNIDPTGKLGERIWIETHIDGSLVKNREGFNIRTDSNTIDVIGGSGAGVLYGCKEVSSAISKENKLPSQFEQKESPAMIWRGISLQLMKLGEYNYAVTPKEFPFFYDKKLWEEFLDFMVDQRFNYLILWNGHPFDYFVKFDKFKEAQSRLSYEQIQQNNQMLKWLIAEGGKRNIKFFFEFYNINTSVDYQEAHKLPKEISSPTPELAAYTGYSIARFVHEFPEIGLCITPGEGLEIKFSDDWINNVIFKAVKSTGYTPTIFMRGWFFDLEHARKIVENYPDLCFMRKFNVEMIADKHTDPENEEWAKLNGNFIVNIHLAGNIEPFRWNPPSYIQEIVKDNIKSGANGIHMHPRKAWRWPYGSDAGSKEYQWKRDTLFFTAWSRYSWNPDREKNDDGQYWIDLLTRRFGNKEAAEHYLKSSEAGADVLPALQRLIWLGYDNHTVVTAGGTLSQLLNSRGIPFLDIKPVLRISEYIEALKTGKTIEGETPIEFLSTKTEEAQKALKEAQIARQFATHNVDELNRIVNDAEAVFYTANFYYHKIEALKSWVLQEEGIDTDKNMKLFIDFLTKSVTDFERLSDTTSLTYESISDVPASHPIRLKKTPYHWNDLLALYKKELAFYKQEFNVKHGPEFYQPNLSGLAGILYGKPLFIDPETFNQTQSIDFNWDNDNEIGKNWSYKWSGFLKAPIDGKTKIIISSDREVQLKIENRFIKLNAEGFDKIVEEIQFTKDQFYAIEILYDHNGTAGGFVKLKWSWDNHPAEVIPKDYLFHSGAQRNQAKLLTQLVEKLEGGSK